MVLERKNEHTTDFAELYKVRVEPMTVQDLGREKRMEKKVNKYMQACEHGWGGEGESSIG